MKLIKYASVFFLIFGSFCVTAKESYTQDSIDLGIRDKSLLGKLDVDVADVSKLIVKSSVTATSVGFSKVGYASFPATRNALSDYETFVPRKSQAQLSVIEKLLLPIYLNDPKNINVIKLIAVYHLDKSLLSSSVENGEAFKHTILAQYFLSRLKDLGQKNTVITGLLQAANNKLFKIDKKYTGVNLGENHEAHTYFNSTFNYHEENRFIAADKLIGDYLESPNNVYTSFLNTAVNFWTGGEADFADSSMLYNFVLGSYFSVRTMDLAQQAQTAWSQDPVKNNRFRLSSILGGFSLMQRKALAIIHHDQAAITLLNEEHRKWLAVNPVFHSFTFGLNFFDDADNFLEGYAAWDATFPICTVRPDITACLNRARFSFNSAAMFVGRADFALKAGDVSSANFYLFLSSLMPNYEFWDYGRDAYTHRQNHAQEISTLYQNDDVSDDPVHFNMRKHKWGGNTSTCQICHQAQSKVWSEEDKNSILITADDILTIKKWPSISTTWYGAIKNL